jgi:ATP-dependent RNA helicase RhlE
MKFTDLNLGRSLLNALEDLNFTEPTAIQAKAFSPLMAGRDVVGIAQTGTGKTFAYLLPCLRMWKFTKSPHPQILVVVPTRELVAQVVEAAQQLTTYMNVEVVGVYGGTNIRTQKAEVEVGVDVLVGTPGRLVDLMADGVLKTKQLRQVIIDEVDEMLNLGFRTQLRNILDYLPKKRQHLMFSATMTEEVEAVIQEFTDYYEKIEAAPSGAPLENIQQYAYRVPNFNTKANLLELMLQRHPEMKKVLIFAKTKKMADALYERLAPNFPENLGIIHSSKSQNNRFDTVSKFQDGTYRCLVATDIIARGLDVSSVTHVVNFDLPDTPEKYIHRIGRTGRAEEKGITFAFVSVEDQAYLEAIESLMELSLETLSLPDDLEHSDVLIPLEKPSFHMPYSQNRSRVHTPSGPAFHEKSDKNKKVNKRISRAEKMRKKYGKPQTRGDKNQRKKK